MRTRTQATSGQMTRATLVEAAREAGADPFRVSRALTEAKGNPIEVLKAAVTAASSFMTVGHELKKAGLKYTFGTEPVPAYMVTIGGKRYGIVNRKYADEYDALVGDIALGKLTEASGERAESALSGMTRARAETFLRKLLSEGTSGIKRDNGWSAINAIFDRLHRAGISIENLKAEYYKVPNSSNLNDGKRWRFEIPFAKGGWHVTITASFAGSAKDPSDAYDITVNLDYSASIRSAQEASGEGVEDGIVEDASHLLHALSNASAGWHNVAQLSASYRGRMTSYDWDAAAKTLERQGKAQLRKKDGVTQLRMAD
jgi:hypothetical protein